MLNRPVYEAIIDEWNLEPTNGKAQSKEELGNQVALCLDFFCVSRGVGVCVFFFFNGVWWIWVVFLQCLLDFSMVFGEFSRVQNDLGLETSG